MISQATGGGVYHALGKMVRDHVMKGRSVNRLSSFVMGGAESFILEGVPSDGSSIGERDTLRAGHSKIASDGSERTEVGEVDRHYIEVISFAQRRVDSSVLAEIESALTSALCLMCCSLSPLAGK